MVFILSFLQSTPTASQSPLLRLTLPHRPAALSYLARVAHTVTTRTKHRWVNDSSGSVGRDRILTAAPLHHGQICYQEHGRHLAKLWSGGNVKMKFKKSITWVEIMQASDSVNQLLKIEWLTL